MDNKTNHCDGLEPAAKTRVAMGVGGSRRTAHHRRSRGTALILTVVSLMLMAVLGMAYIQSVRVNRQAKRNVATSGNLDMVIDAALTQIGNVLKDDLLDGSGKFFNAGDPNTQNFDDPDGPGAGAGDEPYDYPWTNDQVKQTVVLYNGAVVPKTDAAAAKGSLYDDTWLASTAPDTSDANEENWTWPHITNLNGIFLNDVQNNNTWPVEKVVNYALLSGNPDPNHHDKNVRFLTTDPNDLLNQGDLVDADGDGIADSRWTWAPVRKVGGVVYVMAVRIIDNSSLINANVALGILGDYSGVYKYDDSSSGTDSPRWWSPAELDLGNFVHAYTQILPALPDKDDFMGDLQDLLNDRVGTNSLPTPWGTATNARHHYWLNGPAMYGNFQSPYKHLTIEDELELRYRNGLNDDNTVTGLESVMPSFLRSGNSGEYRYSKLQDDNGNNFDVREYFEKNPRLWMTTVSGAAIYATPRLTSDPAQATLRVDLNVALASRIASEIEGVFGIGLSFSHAVGGVEDAAYQLAACVKDYRDKDQDGANPKTELTEVDRLGVKYYGMEYLPFVTEVYTQVEYKITNATSAGSNLWNVTWTKESGDAGYAIEIRNPFPVPIPVRGIRLKITSPGTTTATIVLADTLPPSQDPDKELDPNEVIVVFHDALTGTGVNDIDAKVASETGFTYFTHDGGASSQFNSVDTNNDVIVTLEVDTKADAAAGTPVTYQRVTVAGIQKNSSYIENGYASTNDPTNDKSYKQRVALGNGNGINALAVRDTDFFTEINFGDINNGELPKPIATIYALGTLDKTSQGGPADTLDILKNQLLIPNEAIRQVGELAHIAMIGPTTTNTIAQQWHAAGVTSNMTQLAIDFGSSSLAGTSDDALKVSHAMLLFDRFTTMSPAVDGQDNDGDGDDDSNDPGDDELFIPGTINLNTVQGIEAMTNNTHLLQRVLPIQDPDIRDSVIKAILNYRDKAPPYHIRNRDNPGIAYIGELMQCVVPPTGLPDERIDVLARPGVTYPGGDTRKLEHGGNEFVVDFLSPSSGADGVADDREEEAMIMRWLSQTCSTRSDIFTAYVVIQGFPADDFSKGAVESRRFYAVFDRSRITNKDDAVRVLGVRELH